MTIPVNQNDFKTYKDKSREALKAMRDYCNTDTFINDCKRIAHEKIRKALDNNGNLIWSKLPKLIGQNTKISKDVANLDNDLEIFGLSLAPHYISGFNTCSGLSLA